VQAAELRECVVNRVDLLLQRLVRQTEVAGGGGDGGEGGEDGCELEVAADQVVFIVCSFPVVGDCMAAA
jgi:hypothetical protein